MQIKVKFFALLREGRGKVQSLEVETGTTVQGVLNHFEIDPDDLAILLVNGRDAAPEVALEDGDVLSLFPPSGGG